MRERLSFFVCVCVYMCVCHPQLVAMCPELDDRVSVIVCGCTIV